MEERSEPCSSKKEKILHVDVLSLIPVVILVNDIFQNFIVLSLKFCLKSVIFPKC